MTDFETTTRDWCRANNVAHCKVDEMIYDATCKREDHMDDPAFDLSELEAELDMLEFIKENFDPEEYLAWIMPDETTANDTCNLPQVVFTVEITRLNYDGPGIVRYHDPVRVFGSLRLACQAVEEQRRSADIMIEDDQCNVLALADKPWRDNGAKLNQLYVVVDTSNDRTVATIEMNLHYVRISDI